MKTPRDLASFVDLNESGSGDQEGTAGAVLGQLGLCWMSAKEWPAQGPARRSVRFQLTHSGVYCPVSQLNDVMFRLRLWAMLKSVVCTRGGKRQQKLANQVFVKPLCGGFWEIKADSCNISTEGAAQTSKSFLFYLPEPPVRSLHQLKADLRLSPGEHR